MKDEWYQNRSLESVCALATNVDKFPLKELRKKAYSALRITFLLATNTDFFGSQFDLRTMYDADVLDLMAKNENICFIGGLIIRMLLTVSTNPQMVSRDEKVENFAIYFKLYFLFLDN